MKPYKPLLLLMLSLFASIATATESSWDKLFDQAQYQNAKISPDGKYIAVKTIHQGQAILVFVHRESMTMVNSTKLAGAYQVGNYHWINNERVVINLVKQVPWREEPQYHGELYAINYDGSKRKLIYGYQAGVRQVGTRGRIKKSSYSWAKIIDTLPHDNEHILISSTPMSDAGEKLPAALLLNAYTGVVEKNHLRSPVPYTKFLTNTQGELTALVGTNDNNINKVFLRLNEQWQPAPENTFSDDVSLLSVDPSGQFIYTLDNYKQDRFGVFKYNIKNSSYTSVYTDKHVDVSNVEYTSDGYSVYALRFDNGYPDYLLLNKSFPEAKAFKKLLKSFPYSTIKITSGTSDNNLYIVKVTSDTNPGGLYLYNRQANTLKFLFNFMPKINSAELLKSEPIQIQVSGDVTINGYFTAAKNFNPESPAPVVILVHGGPHGVRDYWEYSSTKQYLAQHGYSVLQVNYRGSGGYGKKFELAGHQAWGTTIQQDILDSYQWLVTQDKAKANSACIMGASFGAYSAVQSATMYPNSYKCAIANAGIYDLELMFEEGDIQESKSGLSYLAMALGNDKAQLKRMSPINYADKIDIPLLLAHGKDDERAPFEHLLRLRQALDKANKPYEWFVIDKEEHGFYNPETKKAYMRKVLSFLDQHLKSN